MIPRRMHMAGTDIVEELGMSDGYTTDGGGGVVGWTVRPGQNAADELNRFQVWLSNKYGFWPQTVRTNTTIFDLLLIDMSAMRSYPIPLPQGITVSPAVLSAGYPPHETQFQVLRASAQVCQHEYVNVSFAHIHMACKKCGKDQ